MALSLTERIAGDLHQLRYVRTLKRVRVELAGEPVADTTNAMVVWEPMRVVPSYAVPAAGITATLEPVADDGVVSELAADDARVLTPRDPFSVHTAPGDILDVVTSTNRRESAAFRLADPDLADYVVLDFDAFSWREEDEPIIGHPRDPFHRIDIRRSGRSVRLEHRGHVLAESTRALMLFEGTFAFARYYVPTEDVSVELTPGTISTICAYKGHATHYSANIDGLSLDNIAWSYQDPLDDATAVRGLISFYQERLDLLIDDRRVEQVSTPWS